jgi:hypothetical protein
MNQLNQSQIQISMLGMTAREMKTLINVLGHSAVKLAYPMVHITTSL